MGLEVPRTAPFVSPHSRDDAVELMWENPVPYSTGVKATYHFTMTIRQIPALLNALLKQPQITPKSP